MRSPFESGHSSNLNYTRMKVFKDDADGRTLFHVMKERLEPRCYGYGFYTKDGDGELIDATDDIINPTCTQLYDEDGEAVDVEPDFHVYTWHDGSNWKETSVEEMEDVTEEMLPEVTENELVYRHNGNDHHIKYFRSKSGRFYMVETSYWQGMPPWDTYVELSLVALLQQVPEHNYDELEDVPELNGNTNVRVVDGRIVDMRGLNEISSEHTEWYTTISKYRKLNGDIVTMDYDHEIGIWVFR